MIPARRLAALAAGLPLALGLASTTAEATVAVPVNCSSGPVEITTDDLTYDLDGNCGLVRVLADDVTVRMPTATRLVVRGQRNTVVAKPVTTLVVRGRGHDVRPVSVRTLRVASLRSEVSVDGLAETVRLGGRGATVTADRVLTLRAPGSHNTLRTGRGYDATIAGDANTVRYRQLDDLAVTGARNVVRVRRGATSVDERGGSNRVSVARRS